MGKQRFKLEADGTLLQSAPPHKPINGRIDAPRVAATTEADIARHAADDDAAAARDAATYARRVRRRTGLTQAAFAARIGVPLDTVRNWEQGKRVPAGPARALLRILDRAPEAALAALG
jgi:putative transcriptional regulator